MPVTERLVKSSKKKDYSSAIEAAENGEENERYEDSNGKSRKRRVRKRTLKNIKPALRYSLWKLQKKTQIVWRGEFQNLRVNRLQLVACALLLLILVVYLVGTSHVLLDTMRTQRLRPSSNHRMNSLLPAWKAPLGRFKRKSRRFFGRDEGGGKMLHVERPEVEEEPILLNRYVGSTNTFSEAPSSALISHNPDYGDLHISFLSEQEPERIIKPDPKALEGRVYLEEDYDDRFWAWDNYHSFDDEYNRNEQFRKENMECRYNAWHLNQYPSCNTFHEIEILKGENKLLGHGAFRAAFLQHEVFDPTLVIKVQLYNEENPFDIDRFEFVRNDAIIMERMTASPRIADIYGHCGSSIYSEFLPNEVEEQMIPGEGDGINPPLHDKHDAHSLNDYTISEKLDIALQMAEAIADLHGYEGGVIVHDDIQPAQFLFKDDGSVILNDFNRGETMLFDEKRGEYCKYKNGRGGGEYRAPEEYKDDALNEKIDVWSFGDNIYGLITGLWVFYETQDMKKKIKAMVDGKTAKFDERFRGKNRIQDVMIDLMYRCWEYDADKRADIFEAVVTLRGVLKEGKELGIYDGRF